MGKKVKIGDEPPLFINTSYNAGEIDLKKIIGAKPVVLIFSRYFGCPICQLELLELLEAWPQFEAKNINLFYITQSGEEIAQKFIQEKNIPFPVLPSTKDDLYSEYGLGMMNISAAAKVPGLMLKAKNKGISHGAFEGSESQMPGQFIIDPSGRIKYAHYGWQDLTEILNAL